MKKIFFVLMLTAVAALVLSGCGKADNKNALANTAEKKMDNSTTNTSATPAKESDTPSAGSLATPTDAYKTAWAAREKKDLAGVKRVLSKDVIAFLTDMAEVDKKTLDQEIGEMFESPQAKTAEARDEKITGDKATIEYLDEQGKWKRMDFVKEGSDWKWPFRRTMARQVENREQRNRTETNQIPKVLFSIVV